MVIAITDLNGVKELEDIAGMVAAMTESELDARVKESPMTSLVDRDSATRWARRLAVQFDVGELSYRSQPRSQPSV